MYHPPCTQASSFSHLHRGFRPRPNPGQICTLYQLSVPAITLPGAAAHQLLHSAITHTRYVLSRSRFAHTTNGKGERNYTNGENRGRCCSAAGLPRRTLTLALRNATDEPIVPWVPDHERTAAVPPVVPSTVRFGTRSRTRP